MINTEMTKQLMNLGYSRAQASHIFAAHLSAGTLDALEAYIEKQKQICKE